MSIFMRGFNNVNELKDFYEKFFADDERPSVREAKTVVEGYFITGTVSEEVFLTTCDYMDNELYDDYKDMYESASWFINLQHYAENLQRITGKKPRKRNKKWMFLKIQTEQD